MHSEGYVSVEGGRIWYRITGDGPGIPLIVLHGGPGSSHISLEPLRALGATRPVVFYDQLGCGQSERPTDESLWHIERFVRELVTLRKTLNLEQVHILGHSWGTMLLADYLLTQPVGVISAIFSSPCLSATRWVADAQQYRLALPAAVQAVLDRCEAERTTDTETYRKATEEYNRRHVCRVAISKADQARRSANFGEQVYNYMWGPSEFFPTGNLKTYDRTDRLSEIRIPCLFTCGRYDEASPPSTAYYHSLVPDSAFHIFEASSHSPFREQQEDYLTVIRRFLDNLDTQAQ